MHQLILNIFILLASSSLLVVSVDILSRAASSLILHETRQCPGKDDLPVMFKDTILNQVSPFHIDFSGKVLVREEIDDPISMKMIVHKCKSKADSTCEHYTTIKLDAICHLMKQWYSFFGNTTLPSQCPYPVGEYEFRHGQITKEMMQMIPLSESNWKLITKSFKGDRMFGCVVTRFAVSREARKKKD